MRSRSTRTVVVLFALACGIIALPKDARAAGSGRDRTMEEVKQARLAAAQRMIDKVVALPLADGRALADALAGKPSKAASSELLNGIQEAQPTEFYGDRTCVVRWRLSAEQLQRSLNAVAEGLKAIGETLDLTLKPVDGEMIEARGTYQAPPTRTRRGRTVALSWPPRRLKGWGDIDAAQVAAAERRAHAAAADAVRGQVLAADPGVTGTFAAPLEEKKARALFDAYLAKLRPAWKRYLPGGFVEVELSLPAQNVIDRLQRIFAALPEDKRPAEAVFEKARKSWGKAVYSARTAVGATGASPAAEMPAFEFRPLSAESIPVINMAFLEKQREQETKKDEAKPTE